jgi:hypothetical protein
MREHPLLMKGPLVRATLEGRKTQTRRPVKPQPSDDIVDVEYDDIADLWLGNTKEDNDLGFCSSWTARCPLGRTGDRLWVRETWAWPGEEEFIYRADQWAEDMVAKWKTDPNYPQVKWSPSIHMPRRACRLVLPLVSVRVERVQDITEEDAIAEGVPHNSDRPIDKSWCAACCGHGIVERFALGMVSVDDCSECNSAKKLFRNIWISIYGQESWDANPWAWVAEWKEIPVLPVHVQ